MMNIAVVFFANGLSIAADGIDATISGLFLYLLVSLRSKTSILKPIQLEALPSLQPLGINDNYKGKRCIQV